MEIKLSQAGYDVIALLVESGRAMHRKEIADRLNVSTNVIDMRINSLIAQQMIFRKGPGLYEAKEGIVLSEVIVGRQCRAPGDAKTSKKKSILTEFDEAINLFIDKAAQLREYVLTPEQMAEYIRLRELNEAIQAFGEKKKT
jgi:DNA-binding Lrp family transcriptional regulator